MASAADFLTLPSSSFEALILCVCWCSFSLICWTWGKSLSYLALKNLTALLSSSKFVDKLSSLELMAQFLPLEAQESRVHYTVARIKSLLIIGEGGSMALEGGFRNPWSPLLAMPLPMNRRPRSNTCISQLVSFGSFDNVICGSLRFSMSDKTQYTESTRAERYLWMREMEEKHAGFAVYSLSKCHAA